jgi:uracil-DNA glycosylase
MRATLDALTNELKRLKSSGVKTVSISDESLAALHGAAMAWKARQAPPVAAPVAQRTSSPPSAPTSSPSRSAPPVAPSLPPPPTVNLPEGDKAARWAALRATMTENPVCRVHLRPGKKLVLGVGNLEARIMFVGEAPGAEEESRGEPFVGPAGQLLDKMIVAMGLKREEVYIGNLMNWRPQIPAAPGEEQFGNRPPTPEEMAYCLPFLRAQIAIVEPALIVALGATAAQALLGIGSFKTLGEIRGRWLECDSRPVMATYHPSYLLKTNSNRTKRLVWEDLLKVMERAGLAISERQRGYFLGR